MFPSTESAAALLAALTTWGIDLTAAHNWYTSNLAREVAVFSQQTPLPPVVPLPLPKHLQDIPTMPQEPAPLQYNSIFGPEKQKPAANIDLSERFPAIPRCSVALG